MTEESNNVKPEIVDENPAYFDALTGLLNQVQLNEDTKNVILKNYRERPQEFEQSAWRMLNYITALGVRENVARYLTSRFWSITKNMDLDLFQGMMNPAQSSPFGIGGIAYPPQAGTPASQYPIPPPQAEDADSKMMRMMMMMKMMNQPATPAVDPMQQMMQMMMMSGGRMGMAQEPMYGANGQPITDSNGNQVMRFTMQPAMQQQAVPQGPDPTLEIFKEIIRGQNEQKRSSDDRYFATLEKQREIESEIAEKESRALRRRLANVEQERSSDRLIEDVEKLRKLGLFAGGGSSPASIEAIKLQTDLDKWKFERETDLSRWQQQTDMDARKWYKERELEEIREARTQDRLGILGDSLKDTLTTVVTPILSSMGSGVAANLQQSKMQPQGAVPDFTNISDQDLVNQYQEVERIDNRAEEAKIYLKAEMERRMASKGVEPPKSNPVPETITSSPNMIQEPKIDLGSLADMQFSSSSSPVVAEEEYEHSEELVDSIGDDAYEDYSDEY
jgi:hypothetical protein